MAQPSKVQVAFFCVLASTRVFSQSVDCSPTTNRVGIFSNISSSGNASKSNPITACTIINAHESVDSTTAFFAESSEGDAVLEIFYVEEPKYEAMMNLGGLFPKRIFDNWVEALSTNEAKLLETRLRTPYRHSDAAALMTSDGNYYATIWYKSNYILNQQTYNFGVCASGYPKDGQSWTNVSITNLGPGRVGRCYPRTGFLFER